MENFCIAIKEYGVTVKEACNAISLFKAPLTEMDIILIQSNPGLSRFQKWKLVREIKKELKNI